MFEHSNTSHNHTQIVNAVNIATTDTPLPTITPTNRRPCEAPVQSTLDLADNLPVGQLPIHKHWIERIYDRRFIGADPTPYYIESIFRIQFSTKCEAYLHKHGTDLEYAIWRDYYQDNIDEVSLSHIARTHGVMANTAHKANARLIKKLQNYFSDTSQG
jgi:hypothetical protein